MAPNKKQIKLYPNLWAHLKSHLHLYPWKNNYKKNKDKSDWEQFQEAAGIVHPDLGLARLPMFLWGWPQPIITVESMKGRYAHFTPSRPREILLSENMVNLFEANSNNKRGQTLVVAKTLHEMVHFVRYNFSNIFWQKVEPESPKREMGDVFEIVVYNRVLQMQDDEW